MVSGSLRCDQRDRQARLTGRPILAHPCLLALYLAPQRSHTSPHSARACRTSPRLHANDPLLYPLPRPINLPCWTLRPSHLIPSLTYLPACLLACLPAYLPVCLAASPDLWPTTKMSSRLHTLPSPPKEPKAGQQAVLIYNTCLL